MKESKTLLQAKSAGLKKAKTLETTPSNLDTEELNQLILDNLCYDILSHSNIANALNKRSTQTFKEYDNRLLNLELVKTELTDAIMFDCDGQITLASDELYKKEILVARGSYRPPTKVNLDILKTGVENFKKGYWC